MTTLAARTADAIAELATRAPAIDLLGGDPAPSRRQVAAVMRCWADFTLNEHMVAVCTDPSGALQPRAISDYLMAIAEDMASDRRRPGAATSVAGKHVADRNLQALAWGRGDLDLRDEPRPTHRQFAAVLFAMADREGLTLPTALASHEVFELGASSDRFGPAWQRATGIGRFFHALADKLIGWPNDVLAIPTGVEAEESARRGYMLVQERMSAEGETEATPYSFRGKAAPASTSRPPEASP